MRLLKNNLLTLLLVTATLGACSQQKPSDRDIARQQEISLAEVKRAELAQVEGRYQGMLLGDSGFEQPVILSLQVRDIPEDNPGEGVDPILIPKLVGYLRFLYGNEDLGEYSDAPIKSAEYYSNQKKLNIVVNHSQFGDLILNLSVQNEDASGSWGAGSVGASGTAQFNMESGN